MLILLNNSATFIGPGTALGGGGIFIAGPADNLFGAAGNTGDFTEAVDTVIPAADKATAETTRDTYFAANSALLAQYDSTETLFILVTYTSGGDTAALAQTRVSGAWVDNTTIVAVQGLPGSAASFANVDSYELVMAGAGPDKLPIAAGARRLESGAGNFQFDATAVFPQESIQVGFSSVLSSFGSLIQTRSFISGRRFIYPFTYFDKATGSERTVEMRQAATDTIVNQADDSTGLPLSGTFTLVASSSEALTAIYLRMQAATGITGLRFRATIVGQPEPFYYYPTEADYREGVGTDFADTTNTPNEITLDLTEAPIAALEAQTITVEYAVTTGVLMGDGTNPYLRADRNVLTLEPLARVADIVNAINNGVHSGIQATATIDVDGNPLINLTAMSAAAQPSISAFSADGSTGSVPAGTDVGGERTFNYVVENPGSVQGNLTLLVGATVIATNISPTGNQTTHTLTSQVLAAGESATFTLRGSSVNGVLFSRTFTESVPVQTETLYVGTMATNDAATVDVSTLSIQQVQAGSHFNFDFVLPDQHYAVILSPADREITSILERTFNVESLSDFTKTENVRTIGAQSYDAYTHKNNAGVQGTLAETITVG